MKPPRIKKLLYFAKDGADVLPPEAAQKRWGFTPAGVNFYYGLNAGGLEHFRRTGSALRENHRRFFDLVKQALATRECFLVNLGLWPFEPGDPYAFVAQHPELVRRLAEELGALQTATGAGGKRLEIVIRYASEMNDPMKPGQPWGRPHGAWDAAHARPFRDTFRQVRQIFRRAAPEVRFTFSPALRSDISGPRYEMIGDFWPGKDWVDGISCTWYAGRQEHVKGAAAALERYLSDMSDPHLPFGLDEIGGIDGERDNDRVLAAMLRALDDMGGRPAFDYATLFLHGKWAVDATLGFLTREQTPRE